MTYLGAFHSLVGLITLYIAGFLTPNERTNEFWLRGGVRWNIWNDHESTMFGLQYEHSKGKGYPQSSIEDARS